MIQYSSTVAIDREAAAYWIPAFAGMTTENEGPVDHCFATHMRTTFRTNFTFQTATIELVLPDIASGAKQSIACTTSAFHLAPLAGRGREHLASRLEGVSTDSRIVLLTLR